jgi:hypothetical protein
MQGCVTKNPTTRAPVAGLQYKRNRKNYGMSNLQRHHKSQHSTLDDPMLAALQSSAKSAKFSNSSTLQLDAGSVRESVMLFFLRIPGLP